MENDIIEYVSNNPGTCLFDSSLGLRYTEVLLIADGLVSDGRLCVRYQGERRRYYVTSDSCHPGTSVSAHRHEDGTLHVYFDGNDVGVRISSGENGKVVILETDDDEFWFVNVSSLCAMQVMITSLLDRAEQAEKASYRLERREADMSYSNGVIEGLEHAIEIIESGGE